MNNKLKNKNGVISMILIAVITIGVIACYPLIKKEIFKTDEPLLQNRWFLSDLTITNHINYLETVNKNKDKKISAFDLFLEDNKTTTEKEYEEINNETKEDFKEYINSMYSDGVKFYNNFNEGIIDYYIFNKDTKVTLSNIDSNNWIENILKDDKLLSTPYIVDFYETYIVMSYDDEGMVTLNYICGDEKTTSRDDYLYSTVNYNYVMNDESYNYKPIKNTVFIYGIKDINALTYLNTEYLIYQMDAEKIAYKYILIAFVLVIILGCVTKYEKVKDNYIIRKFLNVSLELNMIIGLIYFIALVYLRSLIIGTVNENIARNLSTNPVGFEISKVIVILINFVAIFIVLFIMFYTVILIKKIFKTKIIKYIKENSIIIRNIIKIFKYIKGINLKNKGERRLLLIIFINLVIVSAICALWFFGIIAMIVYTIILYILLNKYINKIFNNYNKLLEATVKISEGNLEYEINEDLEAFEPFKKELYKVKEGYKKALNDEVKSQKIKGELISNVSHDLKTPLTSIINYTELLKDENLDYITRKEYIYTLDRKSKRLKILIEDLFEVSKAERYDVKLNLSHVNIISLLKQTLDELEDKIKESNLFINLNLQEEEAILEIDQKRMIRVFENLIVNITKYSLENTRVYIDAVKEEEQVFIIFKNVSKEEIDFNEEYLLERFVRGDKSRNTEGSGLGLAIAKSFVELQGGNFEIKVDGDLFKVIISFNFK
ncbi:MAG: histidine kinase dimerization/phospho-acceptor domain-containing protein [Clostridium sp.]|uniref:histidine kinase dimerization/phospho-acceptor domain-containing protein n=1 Tax=Clostridium sp. TaxID=1506 RepID=UPI003F32BBCC